MSWLCPTVTAVPLGYVCTCSFLHGPGVLAPLVLSLGAEPGEKIRAGKHGFLQTFLGELLGEDEELCRSYTIYFFIFLSEQNRSRVSKPP